MYIHMGEVIREIRIKKGWTMKHLADVAELGRHTVYRIEATGQGRIENLETLLGVMGYELEAVSRFGRSKDDSCPMN